MTVFKKRIAIIVLASALSSLVYAESQKEQLVMKTCLLNQLNQQVNVLAKSGDYRLVEMNLDESNLLLLRKYHKQCGKFINVSRHFDQHMSIKSNPSDILKKSLTIKPKKSQRYDKIKHQQEVNEAISNIESDQIWQNAQHLTSYTNRSATTKTGIAAAQWFKDKFDQMAKLANRTDVDSYFVTTGRYKQPSVVTVIGKDLPGEAVVIGAHTDTFSGNKPGADDDASGITVELEVARVLLESNVKLRNPVYIIAYAAEERGLVGSGYVVDQFLQKGTPVKAVMQLDQAGYRANPKDKTIWFLTDYVDDALTAFAAKLLTHYVKIPVSYTRCGYACSDHAVWYQEGFNTIYPSATTLDDDNPYVHTSEDRLEIINLEHMVNFTKLGLAFAIELSLD